MRRLPKEKRQRSRINLEISLEIPPAPLAPSQRSPANLRARSRLRRARSSTTADNSHRQFALRCSYFQLALPAPDGRSNGDVNIEHFREAAAKSTCTPFPLIDRSGIPAEKRLSRRERRESRTRKTLFII